LTIYIEKQNNVPLDIGFFIHRYGLMGEARWHADECWWCVEWLDSTASPLQAAAKAGFKGAYLQRIEKAVYLFLRELK
jgi:hypothetical protein